MEKVTIRKPCYTDLEDMPRIPGGVWCTKCGEKVEDVSKMSDEELVKWIGDNSKHKPCGIYTNEQAKIPFTEKFLMPLKIAAATVSSLFIHEGIHAQVTPVPMNEMLDMKNDNDTAKFEFNGRVVSQKTGAPLEDVSVYISDGDSLLMVVQTRADGTFHTYVPKKEGASYMVSFSAWQYRSVTFESYVPCQENFEVKMKRKPFGRSGFKHYYHHHHLRYRRVVSKF